MTPIFVRPVREQLEHDRLIRFLQAKLKKKYEVVTNVGDSQQSPLRIGDSTFYPDLILTTGKKIEAVIEVETGESTNNLEAMAQWTHFSRSRVPFHLYVPVPMIDAARRLCEAYGVVVAEVWTYRAVNDQFDLVRAYFDPNTQKAVAKAAARFAKDAPKVKTFLPKPEPPKPVVVPKPVPEPVAEPVKGVAKKAEPVKGAAKKAEPVRAAAKSAEPVKAAPKKVELVKAASKKPAPKASASAKPKPAATPKAKAKAKARPAPAKKKRK